MIDLSADVTKFLNPNITIINTHRITPASVHPNKKYICREIEKTPHIGVFSINP